MAKDRNAKPAKNVGTNKQKNKFDPSVLRENPPIKPKKLPQRVYKRGQQGTFVYSPDIAIYIYTADHGIIDIGPYMTSWTLQRTVNAASVFQCTFDNKFSRYDRVIRRMDRIAVFVKRVEWLQVFAGYITLAPWETIVPGDSTIEAECTLKRLYHTYWDTGAASSFFIFPMYFGDGAWKMSDGGAGESMFRLLTQMVHWDSSQIKVQKIPASWIEQAAKLIQKVQAEEYNDNSDQLEILKKALHAIMSSYGIIPTDVPPGPSSSGDTTSTPTTDPHITEDAEAQWKKTMKNGQLNVGNDVVSIGETASPSAPSSLAGSPLYLRADAAAALDKVKNSGGGSGVIKGNIAAAYLSTNQMNNISGSSGAKLVTLPKKPEGWGTTVSLVGDGASWANKNRTIMEKNGWTSKDSSGSKWVFNGNGDATASNPGALGYKVKGWPATSNTVSNNGANGNTNTTTSTNWLPLRFWPTQEMESNAYIGSRAWVNDVPVIESILTLCNASNRDFMSAPNGDFIAFFPDRTGANGKEPVVLIRDIEVVNLNLEIRDDNLVTHYISVGDLLGNMGAGLQIDVMYGGMVTIEMEELMKFLFGYDEDVNFTAIGDWMLGRFGIRPKREDVPDLRDSGWNYCLALHRFQEFWAAQWIAPVEVTFLPEIYPGMRVELADHNLAFYVEELTHSGSRLGGWSTSLKTSTPMHRVNGKWRMLRAEWPVGLEDAPETTDITQWTRLPYIIPTKTMDTEAAVDDPTQTTG